MAAFIRDRDARHKFRNKYKIRSKFRKLRDDNRRLFHENKILIAKLNRLQSDYDRLNTKGLFRITHGIVTSHKNFLSIPDITNRYKKLIRGLDDESIECVDKILGIMSLISQQDLGPNKSAVGWVDIFTEDEKKQLDELNKNFKQRIVTLGDGCFAYKNYILPVKWFLSNVFYYKQEMHKLNHLERFSNKDIIDVGGCIADSAIVFTEYTSGKVYTFEPTTQNYDLMLKTIELNECKNIIPVKMGLGSKDEKLYINMKNYEKNRGANKITKDQLIPENPDDYEHISITTLDNYVKGKDLDIGLIKVDIEGFEQEFLKGAEQTIKKYKPTMLLSIYHNSSDFFDIKPIVESWDLGYSFKISRSVYGFLTAETMLICEQP